MIMILLQGTTWDILLNLQMSAHKALVLCMPHSEPSLMVNAKICNATLWIGHSFLVPQGNHKLIYRKANQYSH